MAASLARRDIYCHDDNGCVSGAPWHILYKVCVVNLGNTHTTHTYKGFKFACSVGDILYRCLVGWLAAIPSKIRRISCFAPIALIEKTSYHSTI